MGVSGSMRNRGWASGTGRRRILPAALVHVGFVPAVETAMGLYSKACIGRYWRSDINRNDRRHNSRKENT